MKMLSRVAARLYWSARYLERVENIARLVSVYDDLLYDLPRDIAVSWYNLIEINSGVALFGQRYKVKDERNVLKFLLAEWGPEKFRQVLQDEYLGYELPDGPPPAPAPYAGDHVGGCLCPLAGPFEQGVAAQRNARRVQALPAGGLLQATQDPVDFVRVARVIGAWATVQFARAAAEMRHHIVPALGLCPVGKGTGVMTLRRALQTVEQDTPSPENRPA